MASIRLLLFLFALVSLHFFKRQVEDVAGGRRYDFPTQVRKIGRIMVKELQEGGGGDSSPSTIIQTLFDDFNYGENNGNLNEKYNLVSKRGKSSNGRHLLDGKGSSFIAFNADYFVAKPHPPKNNGGKCL